MKTRPSILVGTALGVALLAGSGCYLGYATNFDAQRLRREPGWVATPNVPFVHQHDETDCGAAAVAMVLTYWGVPTKVRDVLAYLRSPKDRGITPAALRRYINHKRITAFFFAGEMRDLEREIGKGRPVIVGVVKPYLRTPLAHYEVVVAVHPKRKLVVTLDPARGWRQNTYEGFTLEWKSSRKVTMVVFRVARARHAAR